MVEKHTDPITTSVVQHRLRAIVEEMGEAMLRTSYSQILNSSRDFSTGICDCAGRLVAQAEHVPIHVGALPWAVQSVAKVFADRARPADLSDAALVPGPGLVNWQRPPADGQVVPDLARSRHDSVLRTPRVPGKIAA